MADDNSIKTVAKNFQAAANAFARLDEEVKKRYNKFDIVVVFW